MQKTLCAVVAALLAAQASARGDNGGGFLDGLTLDVKAGNSSQADLSGLTLNYRYDRPLRSKIPSEQAYQWGEDVSQIWFFNGGVEANGSIVLMDENPQGFSEAKIDFGAELHSLLGESDVIELTGFYTKEGDDEFEKRQSVYGASLALAASGIFTQASAADNLVLRLSYGNVDPSGDESREALLEDQLEDFDRVHLRAEYAYNFGSDSPIRNVELTYNEYREQNAPALIRAAGLDEYSYSTIALYLPNNFALTYGKGKLPFDQEEGRIVQLGYQLQSW